MNDGYFSGSGGINGRLANSVQGSVFGYIKQSFEFLDKSKTRSKSGATKEASTSASQSPENKGSNDKQSLFNPKLSFRQAKDKFFHLMLVGAVTCAILLLCVLLMDVAIKGMGWLDWQFITSFPSRFPEKAGIWAGMMGTLWVIGFTALFSIPIGIGAAIYLEEYSAQNKLTRIIEVNIANLAGVPSIIYGLLGLVIFVRGFMFGRSVLSGALTMSLLVLPIIIVASREALKSVPNTIREASYALGATKWQTIRSHVLPAAIPAILTGIILAVSRAIGETAPLIIVGAASSLWFTPTSPLDDFTVLPIQIYDWTGRPQEAFHNLAATGIIVLLVVLLSLNAIAIFIRNHYQRKHRW